MKLPKHCEWRGKGALSVNKEGEAASWTNGAYLCKSKLTKMEMGVENKSKK